MTILDVGRETYEAVQEIYFTGKALEQSDTLSQFMDQFISNVLASSDVKKVFVPGTYDTVTKGHISLFEQLMEKYGDKIDKIVIGIGVNPEKRNEDFTLKEREEMIYKSLESHPKLASKVEIISYTGFLYDFADEKGIPVIVRGIRGAEEYKEEKGLRDAGRTSDAEAITYYMPAEEDVAHISSSYTKMVLEGGGPIAELVSPYVKQCLEARKTGQYRINLTGVMNAGKSYVGSELERIGEEAGIPVNNIELDPIIHQIYDGTLDDYIYKKACENIIKEIGEEAACEDGTINRDVLREKVAERPEILNVLTEILYKPLMTYVKRHELFNEKGLIIFNAALVAESDMNGLANNNVILVSADDESLERRFDEEIGTGKITEHEFHVIQSSQYTEEGKIRKINEDIEKSKHGTIFTYDNSDDSHQNVESLFHEIIREIDQYGQLRFTGLWNRLKANGDPEKAYRDLVGAYLGGDRIYHSIPHIIDGLNKLEDAIEDSKEKGISVDSDTVLFEWFYHDIIKDKMSWVDEKRSAEHAYNACIRAELGHEFAEKVKNGILVTKHDDEHCPNTIGEELLADADLSILGESAEIFDEYEKDIRREYYWVDEEEFVDRRIAVLEKFQKRYLDGGYIYYTDYFRDGFEEMAVENLERSISQLKEEQAKMG